MKKILAMILVFTMILGTFIASHTFSKGAALGSNLFIGHVITAETEAFCIEQFQDARCPEHLAKLVINFATKHFTYDMSYITVPQTIDTNRFIFKNNFHGVCADFSAFVNTVLQVVSKHRGWDYVGTHLVNGIDPKAVSGHSINYMSVRQPDGSVMVYEIDTTWDLARYEADIQLQGLRNHYRVDSEADIPDAIRILYACNYSDFSINLLY